MLRNTTNSSLNYTVTWRNAAGAVAGTQSGTLGGNASTFFNAREVAGVLPTNASGTVEIAYTGAPGGIAANTTVLSNSSGLSFDAPFYSRPTW